MPSPAPNRSSTSPAARFLDRPAVLAGLRATAARLAAADPRVERVVLYGSLATGHATVRSDADIFVVLRDHPLPPRERIPEYLRSFLDAPLPVDVIALTTAEISDRRARGDRLLRHIDAEGIVLAGGLADQAVRSMG
jgi:predicted nucleotidyltransferase